MTPSQPLTSLPHGASIRILGVDPGLRITGFGVIEKAGNALSYLASGCIKTDAKASLPTRLGTIYAGLRELVEQYRPDQSAIEIVFVNVNPQSALLLRQARGAAVTAPVSTALGRARPMSASRLRTSRRTSAWWRR